MNGPGGPERRAQVRVVVADVVELQAVVAPPPHAERSAGGQRAPYRPPRLCEHGPLAVLTEAAEGTINDGAGGFFAFSGAAG